MLTEEIAYARIALHIHQWEDKRVNDKFKGSSPSDASTDAMRNDPLTIQIAPEITVLRLARALAMEGLGLEYRNGTVCIVNRKRYLDGGRLRHGWVPDFLRHKTGD